MKIIVVGASGTIGAAVVQALAAQRHEVVGVSRHSSPGVDIDDAASIDRLFGAVSGVDALVCCAGNAAFGPLAKLSDADFELGLRSKLMGQVTLARVAMTHLRQA